MVTRCTATTVCRSAIWKSSFTEFNLAILFMSLRNISQFVKHRTFTRSPLPAVDQTKVNRKCSAHFHIFQFLVMREELSYFFNFFLRSTILFRKRSRVSLSFCLDRTKFWNIFIQHSNCRVFVVRFLWSRQGFQDKVSKTGNSQLRLIQLRCNSIMKNPKMDDNWRSYDVSSGVTSTISIQFYLPFHCAEMRSQMRILREGTSTQDK